MKKVTLFFIFALSGLGLLLTGCQNSSGAVWEDTKTMGRYLHRKGRLLWSKDVDSRMIETADEFTGPNEEEFIPLKNEELKTQFNDLSISQPKSSPGMAGSGVPGIEHFIKPVASLAKLFKVLHFNTDEHVLRTKEAYATIANISEYMKKNPALYIFIEGNCDERGSEAYNLALGTRRSNTIRNLLIKQKVNPNRIYTISFGKEKPIDLGHTRDAWDKNRRVDFKLFDKK